MDFKKKLARFLTPAVLDVAPVQSEASAPSVSTSARAPQPPGSELADSAPVRSDASVPSVSTSARGSLPPSGSELADSAPVRSEASAPSVSTSARVPQPPGSELADSAPVRSDASVPSVSISTRGSLPPSGSELADSAPVRNVGDGGGTELGTTLADGNGAVSAGEGREAGIRSRLLDLAKRRAKPKSKVAQAARGLIGEARLTSHGEVHVVAQAFASSHMQGRAPLSRAIGATGGLVAKLALEPRLSDVDFSRALFIDTETTGLSQGAGTIPFLIGMAWYDGTAVQVEQLVLRQPGEEGPMLGLLRERIAAASCIVSYNGKSFDWPLLRTRYVLNRMPIPEPTAHVDLLHCARRVYRRRLTCVQLTELEREVLGLHRTDDVGGAEIPAIYMDFLRGHSGACLTPILTHNMHDLVSLIALLGVLVDKLEQASSDDDVRDQLALAELSVRAGDRDRAHAFATTAAAGDSDDVSAPALALMASVHKRRGEYASAVTALERAVTHADPDSAPRLHLELAKLYERHLRDPSRALEHARASIFAESEIANSKRIKRLTLNAARLMLPLELD